MANQTSISALIAIACAIVLAAAVAGVVAFRELATVTANLEQVDRQLSVMNGKLSVTNALLLKTNASLGTMVAQARSSDAKLARMESDLSVMSHKISGSFLFRGVK